MHESLVADGSEVPTFWFTGIGLVEHPEKFHSCYFVGG